MYLLVFITLVISLIGLYTQTFALQSARIMSRQTGFANAMLTWHGTALALAHYSVDSASAIPGPAGLSPDFNGASGCSLSTIIGADQPVQCRIAAALGGQAATVSLAKPPGSAINNCDTVGNVAPCWRNLPAGYNNAYHFFSIAYQLSPPAQNYVITFVPPPAVTASCPINNFVCLPGKSAPLANQIQLGITLSDLVNQLSHTSAPAFSYGTVIGGFVVTSGVSGITGVGIKALKYPVPTTGALSSEVPENSLAIISTPDLPPCTGC